MTGIKDKVIAITGASRGIGEVTAAMLAERGAKVVLMARSTEERPRRGSARQVFDRM